jgi:hypothetical protein
MDHHVPVLFLLYGFSFPVTGNLSLFRDQGNHKKNAVIAMTCEISQGAQTPFFPVNSLRTGKSPPQNRETRRRAGPARGCCHSTQSTQKR